MFQNFASHLFGKAKPTTTQTKTCKIFPQLSQPALDSLLLRPWIKRDLNVFIKDKHQILFNKSFLNPLFGGIYWNNTTSFCRLISCSSGSHMSGFMLICCLSWHMHEQSCEFVFLTEQQSLTWAIPLTDIYVEIRWDKMRWDIIWLYLSQNQSRGRTRRMFQE